MSGVLKVTFVYDICLSDTSELNLTPKVSYMLPPPDPSCWAFQNPVRGAKALQCPSLTDNIKLMKSFCRPCRCNNISITNTCEISKYWKWTLKSSKEEKKQQSVSFANISEIG